MVRASLVVLAVGLAACGPEVQERPLVLLDAQARAAGFRLSVGEWSGAPVTPIAVTPMDDVVLKGPSGTRHLVPRSGELGQIEGSAATVSWRALGKEIDADRFTVRGSAEAARQLAASLDLKVSGEGSAWTLAGNDALGAAAWFEAPSDLNELVPEQLTAATPVQPPMFHAAPAAAPTMQLADDVPAHVGVYTTAEGESLVLDASGGFVLQYRCDVTAGHFYVAGSSVVLVPDSGARRALSLGESGALADNFSRFEEVHEP